MYLIKTSLDYSKYKKKNHFFLGSWCFKDLDKLLEDNQVEKIIPYHWDDRNKYNSDYTYLTSIYEELLKMFSEILNKYHNMHKDVHYWRIIFGPWLRFFIDVLYDRYECIRLSRKHSNKIIYTVGDYNIQNFCSYNFIDFYNQIITDEWNEMIFSETIKFLNFPYSKNKELKLKPKSCNLKNSSYKILRKKSLEFLYFIYSKFIRKNKIKFLFSGSYFPVKSVINLHLKLRQLPYPFKTKNIYSDNLIYDFNRNNITKLNMKINFENFALYLIPKLMPRIYFEDFAKSKDYILREFKITPKIIFTGVNYQSDDNFKIFCAEKKELGSKLIIGQHGGHFGLGKHNQTIDHQISIASKFISWGWKQKKQSNIINLPSVQLSSKNFSSKKNGYVVHIISSLPRYFYCNYSIPVAGQYLSYLNDQIVFLENLSKPISNRFKIRLDSSFKENSWNLNKIFSFYGYSRYIDLTKKTMPELLNKSCLSICTHNGTVYLETLSKNFPTIIFWDKRYNEIKPESKKYIKSLVDAEILFFSPVDAAKKVNDIGGDVESWWLSDDVQLTVKDFCQQFAHSSIDWAKQWSDTFNKL